MTSFAGIAARGVNQEQLRDWAERFYERDQTMGVLERVEHLAPGAVDEFMEKRALVRDAPDRESAVQRLVDHVNAKWDRWYGAGAHLGQAAPTNSAAEDS